MVRWKGTIGCEGWDGVSVAQGRGVVVVVGVSIQCVFGRGSVRLLQRWLSIHTPLHHTHVVMCVLGSLFVSEGWLRGWGAGGQGGEC